jgi:hypothetical protein
VGLLERIRGNGKTDTGRTRLVETLREAVIQREDSLELLTERLAELELALEDEGWLRLGLEGELDFSRPGIRSIIKLSRLMAIKNPLVKNGVAVQKSYVFGRGVQIKGVDPRVDQVVQRFLHTAANEKMFSKHQARMDLEADLQIEGQIFFALFTNVSTGEVTVRTLPVLEIDDIISNPEDAAETWWYKRTWTARVFNQATGTYELRPQTRYYRDWRIPKQPGKVGQIGGAPVAEDVWVYHVKVGALRGMKFGVPETYASLDWARAYKDWLTSWASLEQALAKFAWRLSGKSKQLRKAKEKLATTLGIEDGAEDNPPPVDASTALTPENMQLEAIPKTGAHVAAEDGTQLRKMAAAGMGIADNVMSSDPQQGTMATAKTLDRPTELSMRGRQLLWTDVFSDLCGFAVARSRAAPNGRLREALAEAEGNEPDLSIVVTWPDILERDPRQAVRAVVDATTLGGRPRAGTLPDDYVTRALLVALAEEDIDKVLEGFEPGALPAEEKAQIAAAVREVRRELVALSSLVSESRRVVKDVERGDDGEISRIVETAEP